MSYKDYLRYCQFCGVAFRAPRADTLTCSNRCRVSRHRSSKNAKVGLVNELTTRQKEDYWFIRDNSQRSSVTIQEIYTRYGLEAARMSMLACIQTYENQNFHNEQEEDDKIIKESGQQ